ncbi:MAG: glycosyltransferase family 2 protein [Deltaproteobacteria bacterium]|nr:glycosyltransferase family 2 protein [Deltaproteobacteria bacterium]MBN2673728.1 glycosyltransferase family 2 protein [Deltaproteobacteria bacterium]
MKKTPLISMVVPALDEAENIPLLYNELKNTFSSLADHCRWELIIVNDGSTDNTKTVVDELARKDSRILGIHFTKNFGQQAALIAGLEHATGEAVITIDADLEQPPHNIHEMLQLWQEGVQVVHSVRRDHPKQSFFKRWSSKQFYRIFSFLSRIPMEPGMLDFRLLDRKVVDAVLSMPEADFFLRGIAAWIGFSQARIPYQAALRKKGKTKYSLRRMISFAIRGITSFSTFPLRLATYLGAVMTIFSLGFGVNILIHYFFWEHPNPGYASTVLLISFLMGIQFLLIGLLGEYVARIHMEVKKRPRYFIASKTSDAEDQDMSDTKPLRLLNRDRGSR